MINDFYTGINLITIDIICLLCSIIGFIVGLTEDKESRQNFLMVTLVLLVGAKVHEEQQN